MLLLVIETDLDQRFERRKQPVIATLQGCRHRRIDMGAISGDLGNAGPGNHSAIVPRVPRAADT